jgi:hypothetical protein
MNRTARKLLLCSLALTGFVGSALGQQIDVRILDERNGRSLTNEVVWLQFYEAPGNRMLQRIQYKTGTDGVAHVQLPVPRPTKLVFATPIDRFQCAGFVDAETSEIISRGATSGVSCRPNGSPPPPNPKAGEVVIIVKRMPWWYRLLAPLERE